MLYRLFGPAGRAPRYFRKPVDLIVWLDTPHRHIPFPPTSPIEKPNIIHHSARPILSVLFATWGNYPYTPTHDHPPQKHVPNYSICQLILSVGDVRKNLFPWNCSHGPYTLDQVNLLGVLTCSIWDACCTPLVHDLSVLFPSPHHFTSAVWSHRCDLFPCLRYNFCHLSYLAKKP